MSDKSNEFDDEEYTQVNWPYAFMTSVRAICLVIIILLIAQCQTGRIW